MTLYRRIRGLLGMALTWGVVGAAVGVATFPIRFRLWPRGGIHWSRVLELFQLWESGAVMWGVACGLAFGVVILVSERSRRFNQLSARRVTLWGALAGAAFPMLLSIRPIHYGASVSYFGMIIGASAVACGLWARGAIAIARRVPTEPESLMMLDGPASPGFDTVTVTRDRVR